MRPLFLVALFAGLLPQLAGAQNWDVVWRLPDLPFQPAGVASEVAMVKAGLDTDQDGWGEFLFTWTDTDTNAICMYEATADNTYELVWYWLLPVDANSFAGMAVGNLDDNDKVDILVTMPMTVDSDPNPMRIWAFEWSGVQGENAYGYPGANPGEYTPTSSWNFNLANSFDFRPYSLTVEDIDKDQDNELIVGVRMSGAGSIRQVLVVSVTGEFSLFASWEYEFEYRQSFGGGLYSVTTGDLDADGNQEIYAFIWNMFTMRIFECTGDRQYTEVFSVDELDPTDDYGALDAVLVADVNDDGVREMYIAGTEDPNQLFIVTGVTDVSQMTSADIKKFYTIPVRADGGFRSMQIADPDKDGKANLMIAGEQEGCIYSLEYKGTGDPADSASWDLQVLFDIWNYSGLEPGTTGAPTPRLFYGSPASDMDKDGKDEYVFVNYRTNFTNWSDDAYIWLLEVDVASDVNENPAGVPTQVALAQNYPNPFNPSTTIRYELPAASQVRLSVFDMLGREVSVLVDERREAGVHEARFDGSGLASGVYLYKLQAGNAVHTRQLVLLR